MFGKDEDFSFLAGETVDLDGDGDVDFIEYLNEEDDYPQIMDNDSDHYSVVDYDDDIPEENLDEDELYIDPYDFDEDRDFNNT